MDGKDHAYMGSLKPAVYGKSSCSICSMSLNHTSGSQLPGTLPQLRTFVPSIIAMFVPFVITNFILEQ